MSQAALNLTGAGQMWAEELTQQTAAVAQKPDPHRGVSDKQRKRWLARPDLWCADVLRFKPWARQAHVMRKLARHNRVTVRSGHGTGKTRLAAALGIWWLDTHEEAVVLTTAPTDRQVTKLLWREWHSLVSGSALAGLADLLTAEWVFGPRRYALGFSTDHPDRFQGFHSPNLLVIVDEACGVAREIYTAILSLLTGDNSRLLLIGNPVTPSGYFYDSHKSGSGFERLRISSEESPNVSVGSEKIPGLATAKWISQAKADWGEDSPMYRARVKGEFPESASNALVPLAAIERAQQLDLTPEGAPKLGVDVARFGDDRTVLVVRQGGVLLATQWFAGRDLMQTTGAVVDMARRHGVPATEIYVDDIGLGGGVTDRLRELGHAVVAVNAGASAMDPDLYANARAEMWSNMAAAVKGGALSLVNASERLLADLAAPLYTFTSRGQRQLEKKDATKRRIGRSPDDGDALALTYSLDEMLEDFFVQAGR